MMPKKAQQNENGRYFLMAIGLFVLLSMLGLLERPNRSDGFSSTFSTSVALTPTATTPIFRLAVVERDRMKSLLYRMEDLDVSRWERNSDETIGSAISGPKPTDYPYLYQIVSARSQRSGRRGANHGDNLFQRVSYHASEDAAIAHYEYLNERWRSDPDMPTNPLSAEYVPASAVYVPNYSRARLECRIPPQQSNYTCDLLAQHGRYVVQIDFTEAYDSVMFDTVPVPSTPFLNDVASVFAAVEGRILQQVEVEGR